MPRSGEVAEPGLRRTPGTRVNSQGFRGFESPPLRHTVCTISLQSGDGGKSARDVALLRSMRTGEGNLSADALNFMRVFSARRINGSLQVLTFQGLPSPSHRLSETWSIPSAFS